MKDIVLKPEIVENKPEDATLLEPFFARRSEAIRIQRMQTKAERKKFVKAFEMVGCLRCQTTNRRHAACGLCTVCYRWYNNVLQKALRAIAKGE